TDDDAFFVTYRNYRGASDITKYGPKTTGGKWLSTKTTTYKEVVVKENQELFTFYLPASQPVNLTFESSSLVDTAVTILSNSSITLTGNIIVANDKGVRLEATTQGAGADINMLSGAGIFVLDSQGRLPGMTGAEITADKAGLNVSAIARAGSVTLNLMGSVGYTHVEARDDIHLNAFSAVDHYSWLHLGHVSSASGDVYISAPSGIYAHESAAGDQAAVAGQRIELNAGQGAIGTSGRALTIDAREGLAAQAGLVTTASHLGSDIHLHQVRENADLVLVKPSSWADPLAAVYSETGSVSIRLNGGSLLDGELSDRRTATEKADAEGVEQLLAILNQNMDDYEAYWSGIRSQKPVQVILGADEAYLDTSLDSAEYLTLRKDQVDALPDGVMMSGLVRLVYLDSRNGWQRSAVLGRLEYVDTVDGEFNRYRLYGLDSQTGQLGDQPVDLSSIGYRHGSAGTIQLQAVTAADRFGDSSTFLGMTLQVSGTDSVSHRGVRKVSMEFTDGELIALAQAAGVWSGHYNDISNLTLQDYQDMFATLLDTRELVYGDKAVRVQSAGGIAAIELDGGTSFGSGGLFSGNTTNRILITLDDYMLFDSNAISGVSFRTSGGTTLVSGAEAKPRDGWQEIVELSDVRLQWDLRNFGTSEVERLQMASLLQEWFQSGNEISLDSLEDVYERHDYIFGTIIGDALPVDLHIDGPLLVSAVTLLDANGQPVTDPALQDWLQGSLEFSGSIYVNEERYDLLRQKKGTGYGPADIAAGLRLAGSFALDLGTSFEGDVKLHLDNTRTDLPKPGERIQLRFANSGEQLVYYVHTIDSNGVATLKDAHGTVLTMAALTQRVGAAPGNMTVEFLDEATRETGVSLSSDGHITLADPNAKIVRDPETGELRALQDYDRVYFSGIAAAGQQSTILQNHQAYYVLVDGDVVTLFASKTDALVHRQIDALGGANSDLAQTLFGGTGLWPTFVTGLSPDLLASPDFKIYSRMVENTQPDSAVVNAMNSTMRELHQRLASARYDAAWLPVMEAPVIRDMLLTLRNQRVYDAAVNTERSETAAYHQYWLERDEQTFDYRWVEYRNSDLESAVSDTDQNRFRLTDQNLMHADNGGTARALKTGDQILFRGATGAIQNDTVYYVVIGEDGWLTLAESFMDAMLHQTGEGQNQDLAALYPGLGNVPTLEFSASDLANATVYTKVYETRIDENGEPLILGHSAYDPAFGAHYDPAWFAYLDKADLLRLENNVLYPVSPLVNTEVFDDENPSDRTEGDRFVNIRAGGDIILETGSQGSIGQSEGSVIIKVPEAGNGYQGADVFALLDEEQRALLSSVSVSDLAGVYHTIYRYIGPDGAEVSLKRGDQAGDDSYIDFSDSSLWEKVDNVLLSNDTDAFVAGHHVNAGDRVQFLFADDFQLYRAATEMFVYNSELQAGWTAAQQAAFDLAHAAARKDGLSIVDLAAPVRHTGWLAESAFTAHRDGGNQVLQQGALVSDRWDPRYLTVKLTRSISVISDGGAVSVLGTEAGKGVAGIQLESFRDLHIRDLHAEGLIGLTTRGEGVHIVGMADGLIRTDQVLSLTASGDIVGSRVEDGMVVADTTQNLRVDLGADHGVFIDADGIARIEQVSADTDLNIVLARMDAVRDDVSLLQASGDILLGQVFVSGNLAIDAGGRILNALDSEQRQLANIVMQDVDAAALDTLDAPRQLVLQAGVSVGVLGASLDDAGQPVLISLPRNDHQASVSALAPGGVNLFGIHDLTLGQIDTRDAGDSQRGNVRLTARGDLLELALNDAETPAIVAGRAWLHAQTGSIGLDGDADTARALRVNLTGNLTAYAAGNIRLHHLTVPGLNPEDLILRHVESLGHAGMAGRGIVRLSSDRDIVNDGHEHGGPSASRSQPVVIG
ncbi:MAG TPA: hypothetical protein VK062_03925, partial [Burkholderiaceae bacterium]|nr:hypothetical protein [Burkholderiaceae bacterium]